VYALENFARWGLPWSVTEGDPRDLRRGKFVLLDDSATKRFGKFESGTYREFFGQRLKIIGRTKGAKSFTTSPISFMDYRMAQALNPQELRNRTTYVIVKLRPGADVEQVRAALKRRLPYQDVHTSAEWAKLSRSYWIDSTGLGLNMYTTVFLGCLVGVVVVGQTLYTSTMEHLKEFATVKAIGGSDADIYKILTRQALISAILGFGLGLVMSFLMRPVMASLDLNLVIGLPMALSVFVGTVVLCVAAAALSFRKVAAVDPALVFRNG
jgi:putative ABC transport system permease protein